MIVVFIILGVLGFIIGSFLLLGLIVKKEYSIENDITILKPAPEVFDYMKSIKNHEKYNKWWMADPNSKKEFKGTDGTVGFVAGWNSTNNQVGEGEQEIKRIIDGSQIDCEIRFVRPMKGVAQTSMTTTSAGANRTTVKWTFHGKNKFPFNAMFAIFGFDKMLSKDMLASLGNLKKEVEK